MPKAPEDETVSHLAHLILESKRSFLYLNNFTSLPVAYRAAYTIVNLFGYIRDIPALVSTRFDRSVLAALRRALANSSLTIIT